MKCSSPTVNLLHNCAVLIAKATLFPLAGDSILVVFNLLKSEIAEVKPSMAALSAQNCHSIQSHDLRILEIRKICEGTEHMARTPYKRAPIKGKHYTVAQIRKKVCFCIYVKDFLQM